MKPMKNVVTFFIFHSSLFILFTGCGYKPASHYTRAVIGDTVSAQVLISMQDPENTVLIRDAVETAIISRFKASLGEAGKTDTHLNVTLKNVRFSPLQYDENGYIVVYRTTVDLKIYRITTEQTRIYDVRGIYDFVIEPNAIISDQARFQAIRYSADKALDSFVAQVAAEGVDR
jgi:hypothetical protein